MEKSKCKRTDQLTLSLLMDAELDKAKGHGFDRAGYKKRRPCWSSLWCPEQDLNLHSFRNTHLKRTRLPIPPSGRFLFPFSWIAWCPGQDLNLHALIGTTPSK